MTVDVTPLALAEVKVVVPRRIADARGVFCELWNARGWKEAGIDAAFVQENYTLNPHRHTVRGLHYQIAPASQGKLLRVSRGSLFDVVVDVRRSSPTFGRHAATVLSAAKWQQIWIPAGFAHGYCTLEDDTEVHYKLTDFYSPAHERGIAWNDPALMIDWPVTAEAARLSERDLGNPRLADQRDLCGYP